MKQGRGVKSYMRLFVNCTIDKATFGSPANDRLTLREKKFKTKCTVSPRFIKNVTDTLESRITEMLANKTADGDGVSKAKAKANVVAATTVPNQSKELFLLCGNGKAAEVMEILAAASNNKIHTFVLTNPVAKNDKLMKQIGLKPGKMGSKSLKYEKIILVADHNKFGLEIKGMEKYSYINTYIHIDLFINFALFFISTASFIKLIHKNWPSLLRLPFLEELALPMMGKVLDCDKNGCIKLSEANKIFKSMNRIPFEHAGAADDKKFVLAFDKNGNERRVDWFIDYMNKYKQQEKEARSSLERYLYDGASTESVPYGKLIDLYMFNMFYSRKGISMQNVNDYVESLEQTDTGKYN